MKANEFYLLRAFTGEHARGNPAAVIMIDDIKNTFRLQQIANDFNLPATVFLKPKSGGFEVRWFAPESEIGLCGHGTMASTWLMTQHLKTHEKIHYTFKLGTIDAQAIKNQVEIQTYGLPCTEVTIPVHIRKAFHGEAVGYFHSEGKDVVLLGHEDAVRNLEPDWEMLRTSDIFGYIITAKGKEYDMVSRVLLPYVSFLEDPATGSAHLALTPFWSGRLNKNKLHAFQASKRGGEIFCELDGNKVKLRGNCEVYAHGKLS